MNNHGHLGGESRSIKLGTDCSGIDAGCAAMISLGLDFEYAFASDIDDQCQKVLQSLQHPPAMIYGDITKRDVSTTPKVDVYIAGFPCQAYSRLNRNGTQGIKDKCKSGPMYAVLEYIEHHKPMIFLLENVENFLTLGYPHIKGWVQTQSAYYNIEHRILQPHIHVGFPQSRKRVYFVGKLKAAFSDARLVWPKPYASLAIRLDDVLTCALAYGELNYNAMYRILTGQQQTYLSACIERIKDTKDPGAITLIWDLSLAGFYKKAKRVASAAALQEISPCLHTESGRFYLTRQQRFISWAEALALQGFSPKFHDAMIWSQLTRSNIFKMAGNSMCVPLVAKILELNLPQ
jgi:DNA-cytosine methyltransferase